MSIGSTQRLQHCQSKVWILSNSEDPKDTLSSRFFWRQSSMNINISVWPEKHPGGSSWISKRILRSSKNHSINCIWNCKILSWITQLCKMKLKMCRTSRIEKWKRSLKNSCPAIRTNPGSHCWSIWGQPRLRRRIGEREDPQLIGEAHIQRSEEESNT